METACDIVRFGRVVWGGMGESPGLGGARSSLRPASGRMGCDGRDRTIGDVACTTCGSFCSGCNGSENADGCPSGYDADLTCAYVETGCWCAKNCCVRRADGTYQRRRRTCCDCTNNSDVTDRCMCRGKKQWGSLCNQSQWQLDGLIEDESLTDAALWGPS